MMAAMVGALPGRRLAAGGPLARHPPAADFFRPLRLLKVDDRHDVAEIAVELRRAVDVAAVERESVHAARRPGRDVARRRRLDDVEDFEAAAELRILAPDRENFPVDQHDAVLDADLVRQRALGNL